MNYIFLLFFSLFFQNRAIAKDNPLIIYVALSEVFVNETSGTSEQLNHLVFSDGSNTGALRHVLTRGYPPKFDASRRIDVYNKENIRFLYKNCDYINKALDCGVKNGHWTLKTFVSVGDKYSTISTKLYDEKGREISTGEKTAWGKIRYVPQWKLTVVNESGGFMGDKKTEIFEMYPPKIEELPPLITPYHVSQAVALMYVSVQTKW